MNPIPEAHAQEIITVNSTVPCFLNQTHAHLLIQNCNATEDFIAFTLMSWEYISGGYFSMIIVSILIVGTWAKYKTAIYPIFIGIVFLPLSYFAFPEQFISFGITMAFLGVGIYIWWVVTNQTKDY